MQNQSAVIASASPGLVSPWGTTFANAELIANAPADIEALLAALAERDAEIARLRDRAAPPTHLERENERLRFENECPHEFVSGAIGGGARCERCRKFFR